MRKNNYLVYYGVKTSERVRKGGLTGAGADPEDRVEAHGFLHVPPEVVQEPLSVRLSLQPRGHTNTFHTHTHTQY